MMFKNWHDIEAASYTGKCGPLYRIDTVVFDVVKEDNGTSCLEACFWENDQHTDISPIDCFFTNLEEARAYAGMVTSDTAYWFKTNGNGRDFNHVAIEILEMNWVEYNGGDWEPGYAVSTYDWMYGIELDEWHDRNCWVDYGDSDEE